jgi:hypothetical protein
LLRNPKEASLGGDFKGGQESYRVVEPLMMMTVAIDVIFRNSAIISSAAKNCYQ